MCQVNLSFTAVPVNSQSTRKPSFLQPNIPISALLPLLPLLPTSLYLNRGYTIWFHLCCLAYIPTRSSFLRKFLILQGFCICVGWYAAILYEYWVDGQFCHTLYRNMPKSLVRYMIETTSEGYEMRNDGVATVAKALSHVLDVIGHPFLVYLFYKLHNGRGGTVKEVLSWPVVIAAWHVSRLWSMVHCYYNQGTLNLWYFGYDIYKLNNLNVYLAAYVAEGACFGAVVVWKLWFENKPLLSEDRVILLDLALLEDCDKAKGDSKPALVHSPSAFSTESMMS